MWYVKEALGMLVKYYVQALVSPSDIEILTAPSKEHRYLSWSRYCYARWITCWIGVGAVFEKFSIVNAMSPSLRSTRRAVAVARRANEARREIARIERKSARLAARIPPAVQEPGWDAPTDRKSVV